MQKLKPLAVVSCVIFRREWAMRPKCSLCEPKRRRLTHIVCNTRYYSPSAAVAAWSCGGPAGSVLFSFVRHRLLYWSCCIDATALYVTAFWSTCSSQTDTFSISAIKSIFYKSFHAMTLTEFDWRETRNAYTISWAQHVQNPITTS